jgi:hypothetical protein
VRAAAVVVLVAWGCAGLAPSAPRLGIDARGERTGYTFFFRPCGHAKQGTLVRRIEVRALDERQQPVAVVCEIVVDGPTPLPLNEWRYGSTPPGEPGIVCRAARSALTI